MAVERTLSIIKPDAVERGLIGATIGRFEKGGLKPVAIRLERLSTAVEIAYYFRSTEQHGHEWTH